MRKKVATITALLFILSLPGVVLAAPNRKGKAGQVQLTMIGPPGLTKKVLPFVDMDQALWAIGHVASAQARGLVQGVGGGKFNPMAAVKKAEAVAMVIRAMGLEEEALAIKQVPALPGIQASLWASGYLVLAAQKGLINLAGFEPNASASRLWVTVLLVKAAGLPVTASGSVPFSDAGEIPSGFADYVAAALGAGLIAGYEDGSFRPNRSVSRAEMAALIDRFVNRDPGKTVSGTLTEMSTTFVKVDEVQYTLTDQVVVIIDGQHKAYSDLRPGYAVRVVLDAAGKVAVITAVSSQEVYEGTIFELPAGGIKVKVDGTVHTLAVSASTMVTLDGAASGMASLRVGDEVTVTAQAGMAIRVEATAAVTYIAGVVTGASNSLTPARYLDLLVTTSPQPVRYSVCANAEVRHQNQPWSFNSLAGGDIVRLTVKRDLVTVIEVIVRFQQPGETTLTGQITAIGADTITIDGGYPLTVTSATAFTLDGMLANLGSLQIGDTVTLTVVSGVVTRVEAQAQMSQVIGLVQEVATGSLTVLTASGNPPAVVTVATAATVTYQGQPVTYSSIAAGDTVVLTVRRNLATAIGIINRALVSGQIMMIQNPGPTRILTIRPAVGVDVTGDLVEGAVLVYDGSVIAPEELSAGDMVAARFGSDGRIYSLTVTAKFAHQVAYAGTISALPAGGLTVDVGGTEHTVILTGSTIITLDGRFATAAALRVGDGVRVVASAGVALLVEATAPTDTL